jgi:riboflavin kinase/FMN adenylyltransferase
LSVVAIGNFDGLHFGHQVLLKKAADLAQDLGLESVAFTFTPHPRKAPRLMSDTSKEQGILKLGIDRVVFQEFRPEFSALSPEGFIEQILVRDLKAQHVVIGPEFAFGRGASGTIAMLQADKRFKTHVVEPVMSEGELCSSSAIREAIKIGDLAKAARLLGRAYSLTGIVTHGSKRGHQLGFPTANLKVEQEVLPPCGVYEVRWGQVKGVTNIGHRPTFGGDEATFVETHFLDLDQDLYGQYLEIELLRFIRPERKFDSVRALKEQIKQDITTICG